MCGVVGSNPKQQNNKKLKLMISVRRALIACGVNFAKDCETDNSETVKLWDLQDQQIEATSQ